MANETTEWWFKGAVYDSAKAHQGRNGLWYVQVVVGSGRHLDNWEFYIFPPSARFSNYKGAFSPQHILPISLCLWQGKGQGGHVSGKSVASKGGYRSAYDVPYEYEGKKFDGLLLSNGDEFVRKILGWEPSVEGVKEGIRLEELAAQEAEQRRIEQDEQWRKQYLARVQLEEDQKARYEAIFASIVLPPGIKCSISLSGLSVWHEDDLVHQHVERFTSLEKYQIWYQEELVRQEETRRREEARKVEQTKEQNKRREIEEKIPEVKRRLQDL